MQMRCGATNLSNTIGIRKIRGPAYRQVGPQAIRVIPITIYGLNGSMDKKESERAIVSRHCCQKRRKRNSGGNQESNGKCWSRCSEGYRVPGTDPSLIDGEGNSAWN